jgi:hypothetical protein
MGSFRRHGIGIGGTANAVGAEIMALIFHAGKLLRPAGPVNHRKITVY